MSEFFHGWRRKVGCVTLAMALAFTAVWVRSFGIRETIMISRDDFHYLSVWWSNGTIGGCLDEEMRYPGEQVLVRPRIGYDKDYLGADGYSDRSPDLPIFRRYDAGLPAWSIVWPLLRRYNVTLSLWSIVWPLALLSACLILWPRKRPAKSPQTGEAT